MIDLAGKVHALMKAILDEPRPEVCSEVWDVPTGAPRLKASIKSQIMGDLNNLLGGKEADRILVADADVMAEIGDAALRRRADPVVRSVENEKWSGGSERVRR